jgi:hypothetical protein
MIKQMAAWWRDEELDPHIIELIKQCTSIRPGYYGPSSMWTNIQGSELLNIGKLTQLIVEKVKEEHGL